MMLKINKTLPKNKARESRYRCMQRIAPATLICGIMPGLVGLSSYITPAQQTSAAGYDITQISTMQEMQPYICDNTEIGQSATLTDTRDNSTYNVAKLSDGKCWMTENLKLDLTEAGIATVAESDNLSTNFPEVALDNSSVFVDDNTIAQFSKSPTVSTQYPGDGEGYKPEYGYYYSWCAATGGTCSTATANGADASGSICPKGWRLPRSGAGTTNDFAIMGGITSSVSGNTNYWSNAKNISFASPILTVNSSSWLAAGGIYTDGLRNPGTSGIYWSSTASGSTYAYRLSFGDGAFYLVNANDRYYGRSIRCLASGWPEKDVNVVAVRVAPVISIDAVSGMTTEVEPHKVTEGTISATVSANTTYDVLLSTNNTSLTNSEDKSSNGSSDSNTTMPSIPSVSSTNPVQPNNNAWGILNNPTLTNNTHTYSPITTTPTSFYNTEQYNEQQQSTTHTFTIGVSVSPSLPAGEYSTTVTITAVNN